MLLETELKIIGFIKKIFIILSCLTPLLFFTPQYWKEIGIMSWYALSFVMLIRPISDIFPRFSILKKLVSLRKEIGIFAALTTLIHGALIFMNFNMPIIISFFDFTGLTITNHMFFAKIGAIISFVLLITSNMWSVRILKQKWKWLQRFAYLYFFAAGMHVFLIGKGQALWALILMITLVVVWILAKFKVQILK